MYADRYSKSGINPGSLMAAVGLNGAILAALIFSAPDIITRIDPPFETRNIPVTPPPPPDPLPRTKPKVDPKIVDSAPVERPVVPDPVQPRAADPFIAGTVTEPPPIPGTGGGATIPVDPPRPPVLTGTEIDKRYANLFQPTYPPGERRAGNEGRVVVRVLIGTDGRVKQIERISAASDDFFEATRRQALGKWRFKPATRDGVPQEAWRTMSVSFVLNDES